MNTYRQGTGVWLDAAGKIVGEGYAGREEGKNNPALQSEHNLGPLPQGRYWIDPPQDTETHGPFVMWLAREPETGEMFGRSGFGVHGDSQEHPGLASDGCIVLPRKVREAIWNSGDHYLEVTA